MVILNHRLCCHDLKQEIGSRLISSMGKRENDSIICIICVTHPPSRLVVGVRISSRVFRSVCRCRIVKVVVVELPVVFVLVVESLEASLSLSWSLVDAEMRVRKCF